MPQVPTLPSSHTLTQTLRLIFTAQARDVFSRLTLERVEAGEVPDTTAWVPALANATRPLLLQFWQAGMHRFRALSPQQKQTRGTSRGLLPKPALCPAPSKSPAELAKGRLFSNDLVPPRLRTRKSRLRFDPFLFNPRVLDAVDAATLTFCRATNDTAMQELQDTLDDLRAALKEGLARGDALRFLARRVATLFASPWRAFRMAATEASRAVHGGQLFAMQDSGVVTQKAWLASNDACERCQELDGVEVPLDEPFVIEPGGGPYALVMHPPLHPHCFCTLQEVL